MPFVRRNPRLFTTTNAGKVDLDDEFNESVARDNLLDDRIDGVESEGIAGTKDPQNVGKLPTTNGFAIIWVKLILDYFQPKSLDDSIFQDASLTRRVMGNDSVGTPQIIDNNVTAQKIANDAVTPSKIPANSLPFSKWVKPQTASIIGGTTTVGGSWYELTLGDYQIATKKPQNNGPTAVALDEAFNNTPGTNFDGGKIKPDSIDGSSAMKSNSTPLATLKSAGTTASVVCGRTTDQKFVEVTLGALQIISKTTNGTSPSAMNLSDAFNNEAGTPYNGSQLKDGSVPQKKINNYQQFVPFCMGSVNADGSRNKLLNVQEITKNGTGLYRIAFTTAAADANYVCLPVVNDGSGATAVTYEKATGYVVIRTMTLNGVNVDLGFDFEVKSW